MISKTFFPSSNLKISSKSSMYLDLMRGVAAILVMLGHMRALLFVDFKDVQKLNAVVKIFYFFTSFGHQAVVVFFVLSGFFISSSIFRMHQKGQWSWQDYLSQRLVRLWIVLLPALLLTLFWDSAGIRLFGDAVYQGLPSDHNILGFSTIERLGFPVFLSNLFFLQQIVTPTYGSNGPLWSLSCEFWYYIAFPCGLLALLSPSRTAKILYAFAMIAIGVFIGKDIALNFGIWMLGVFVIFLPYLWDKHRPVKSYIVGLGTIPFAITLIFSAIKKTTDISWIIAFAVTLLIYLIFRLPEGRTDGRVHQVSAKLAKWVAGFSYSLYLLHLPLLVFLHAYLYHGSPTKWQPTAGPMLISVLISLLIILYAWLISLVTENKTNVFRVWLTGRLKKVH